MIEKKVNAENECKDADLYGNNAAFTCPVCGKVFLVTRRKCPSCSISVARVETKNNIRTAYIEYDESKIPPLDTLYHYTSIEVFKDIVDNKCLRMTQYDQLNDPTEVIFARNIALEYLRDLQVKAKDKKYKKFIIEYFEKVPECTYVASFSEIGNYLEQWRAYTPKGGVAIGFDGTKLQQTSSRLTSNKANENNAAVDPLLYKCMYSSKEITKLIHDSINDLFNNPNYPSNIKDCAFRFFVANLISHRPSLMATIKHGAYSGEREWRWLNTGNTRGDKSALLDKNNRKYIEVKIDPEKWIKEVWISPHGDREMIKQVLNSYKKKEGLSFNIEESKIPYRVWDK